MDRKKELKEKYKMMKPEMGLFIIKSKLENKCHIEVSQNLKGSINGTVFKLVPLYFSRQAGVVNGIVSAMGGLGGFFPPLVLTFVHNITGQYSIAFMALSEIALACLIIVVWMYFQEKETNRKQMTSQSA